MTDDNNRINNDKEKEDFFARFDKISNEFDKSINQNKNKYSNLKEEFSDLIEKNKEGLDIDNFENNNTNRNNNDFLLDNDTSKTRLERLSRSKNRKKPNPIIQKIENIKNQFFNKNSNTDSSTEGELSMTKRKRKKKYIVNKKQLFKFITLCFLVFCLIIGAIVTSIIVTAPPIEPDNIYSLLAENSIIYDDEGNVVDSLMTSDGLRTNISYSDLPQDLIDAFVSIEDKTFWEHNGFNFIRIFGAIKEGLVEGDSIGGTSTLTQQLARNLYLAETKSEYSLTRKIKEAYYSVLLEKQLSKEQIIEAYLNTIFLGFGTNGVQAASQAYFSKDVQDLTLIECASLASLPQAPDRYALLKRYETEDVTVDNPNIIKKGETYTIVYNDTASDRTKLVLKFMLDQGKITQDEYDVAVSTDIKTALNPSENTTSEISSYFADYVIDRVVEDLMEEYNLEESEANQMIYNNGLRIYTTMNSKMQKIAEQEFANNSNFPKVTGLNKDSNGNILNSSGKVLLYSYDNYFNEDGTFSMSDNEYKSASDGDLILLKGERLNFYKTEVQGNIDYSIEFKDMYIVEDGIFYCIKGGVIQIPAEYKTRDEDGNLIVSKEFIANNPECFDITNDNLNVSSKYYTLKQKIVQPQSAMVIYDYKNGGIKAMVGGRNIEGRLLFNRAIQPRQPGSSIKPIGVYGPALQSAVNEMNSGVENGPTEGNSYGQLWTAASVIDDSPLTIQGKLWPKNWYNSYRGLHTMRQSIEQSINVNAVKIFTDIGVQNSLKFAKKLGITSIVESGEVNDMNAAALALGGMSRGVSPLEMVAAYGSFANKGYYSEPISYTKVTNKRGETLLEKSSSSKQVMDKGVAFIMTDMLRTTVTNGIAGAAAIGSQPVAGKTGTTSDDYDAWFVGFTPQYAASLWIGNDINIELSQGSVAASRIWSKIMKQAHAGLPGGSFPTADNVIRVSIDMKSGRLPSELSGLDPRGTVISEYFIKGTEPTSTDKVHVSSKVCADSNQLATPYCKNVTSGVFVKRPYTVNPIVGDIAYELPTYYCNLHNLDVLKYPINPNLTVNPDFVWDGTYNNPDENNSTDTTTDPGSGDNQDNTNNGNQNEENNPPDWLNFSD